MVFCYKRINPIFNAKGGAEYNLLKIQDRHVRLYGAKIINADGEETNHSFLHVAQPLKYKRNTEDHIGVLIDNRKNEPICMIQKRDIVDVKKGRLVLTNFFGGDGTRVKLSSVFLITPKERFLRNGATIYDLHYSFSLESYYIEESDASVGDSSFSSSSDESSLDEKESNKIEMDVKRKDVEVIYISDSEVLSTSDVEVISISSTSDAEVISISD